MTDYTGNAAGFAPALPNRPADSSEAAYAVTKSNTVALNPVPRGLYIGTGGNVTLRPVGSSADVVYKNVPAGGYLAIRAVFVRSTGTTAADIVAEV